YIMNYYEDTIANNIHNLITYPTDDEIHLVIYEAHEQEVNLLKFLNLSNVDLNQDDDGLEKINKVDCKLNEISKAAELVNTYNMEKIDDLE
ncbi:109_t:CDS:2, partial [Funneliformis geosporum]